MTFIDEIAFQLKDKPSCFVFVLLRISTIGTSEVPQIRFLLLEFLEVWWRED